MFIVKAFYTIRLREGAMSKTQSYVHYKQEKYVLKIIFKGKNVKVFVKADLFPH